MQHGWVMDKVAPTYPQQVVDSTLFVRTLVAPGNDKAVHWNIFGVLDSWANSPDSGNTALYTKANQYGKGPIWAAVLEAQCINLSGENCYGLEIDSMAPPGGVTNGYGVAIFVGRANPYTPLRDPNDRRTGHTLAGVIVAPNWYDRNDVDTGVAFDCQIHSRIGCLRMPIGEGIAWETSGTFITKIDPQTGFWGLWKEPQHVCVKCWNADTGEEKTMWKPSG